jgi:hypothetical protein
MIPSWDHIQTGPGNRQVGKELHLRICDKAMLFPCSAAPNFLPNLRSDVAGGKDACELSRCVPHWPLVRLTEREGQV